MVKFSDSVMVLGSEYKITVSDKKKDKSLDDCDGYCKVGATEYWDDKAVSITDILRGGMRG